MARSITLWGLIIFSFLQTSLAGTDRNLPKIQEKLESTIAIYEYGIRTHHAYGETYQYQVKLDKLITIYHDHLGQVDKIRIQHIQWIKGQWVQPEPHPYFAVHRKGFWDNNRPVVTKDVTMLNSEFNTHYLQTIVWKHLEDSSGKFQPQVFEDFNFLDRRLRTAKRASYSRNYTDSTWGPKE